MIKVVGTWKRNPKLSLEQCENHYRSVHTSLARIALAKVPGLRKYVQNRVISTTVTDYNDAERSHPGEPDFDRFVELYFDSAEDMAKALDTPEMRACLDDHKNFMDITIPCNLMNYEVEEVVVLERDESSGKLLYHKTPADEQPFKGKFEQALADKKAGKPWPW
jgi:uncharacterized protein (TIGR02118 family)